MRPSGRRSSVTSSSGRDIAAWVEATGTSAAITSSRGEALTAVETRSTISVCCEWSAVCISSFTGEVATSFTTTLVGTTDRIVCSMVSVSNAALESFCRGSFKISKIARKSTRSNHRLNGNGWALPPISSSREQMSFVGLRSFEVAER